MYNREAFVGWSVSSQVMDSADPLAEDKAAIVAMRKQREAGRGNFFRMALGAGYGGAAHILLIQCTVRIEAAGDSRNATLARTL